MYYFKKNLLRIYSYFCLFTSIKLEIGSKNYFFLLNPFEYAFFFVGIIILIIALVITVKKIYVFNVYIFNKIKKFSLWIYHTYIILTN